MIHPLFAEIVDSYFHASHRTMALDDKGRDFEPCPACIGRPGRLADHVCPMCNGTGRMDLGAESDD